MFLSITPSTELQTRRIRRGYPCNMRKEELCKRKETMVDNHRREEPTALGIGDSHATTLLQWVSCVGYAPLY